jgi:hypothetical protein
MSSLRDLLDVATTDNLPVATYYGEQQSHSIYYRGQGHCKCYSDAQYSYGYQEFHWCVPQCCVEKVKFEIWGGGGGGGGGCCCMPGAPSHSGQYHQFTVCASTQGVNDLDNCCYLFCVAPHTCRKPTSDGFDGCKTYAIGPGLNNFCACGGCYSMSCCNGAQNGYWGCSHKYNWQVGEARGRWQTSAPATPDNSRAARKICEDNGNYFWGNVQGYSQMDCGDNGNWCMQKPQIPMPAGIDSKMGSFSMMRKSSMAGCGEREAQFMAGNNGGVSNSCAMFPVGSGVMSGDAFGGGCCCGYSGAPGQIRITWYCKA